MGIRVRSEIAIFVALLLSFAALPLAQAQTPEPISGVGESTIPLPHALKAEPIPSQAETNLYVLPQGTTFTEVLGAYKADLGAAGWRTDRVMTGTLRGINEAEWSKDKANFTVLVLPMNGKSSALLMTVLQTPIQIDEPTVAPSVKETEPSLIGKWKRAGGHTAEYKDDGTLLLDDTLFYWKLGVDGVIIITTRDGDVTMNYEFDGDTVSTWMEGNSPFVWTHVAPAD